MRGEKYFKHHGIWDGSGDTFKVCCDCEQLKNDVDKRESDPELKTPFEHLYESIFESRDLDLIRRFIGIKQNRGATIKKWMVDKMESLCAVKQGGGK